MRYVGRAALNIMTTKSDKTNSNTRLVFGMAAEFAIPRKKKRSCRTTADSSISAMPERSLDGILFKTAYYNLAITRHTWVRATTPRG